MSKVHISCHQHDSVPACINYLQHMRTISQFLCPVSHTSNSSAQSVSISILFPTYPTRAHNQSASVLFPIYPIHAHNQSASVPFPTHPIHPHNESASLSCFPYIQLVRTISQHLSCFPHIQLMRTISLCPISSTYNSMSIFPHMQLTRTITQLVSCFQSCNSRALSIILYDFYVPFIFPTHETHTRN